MAMTAPGGGGTTKPGRRQPRRGSLVGRLNRTQRRYECLAQAFPHAPPSLLIEAAGRLRRAGTGAVTSLWPRVSRRTGFTS